MLKVIAVILTITSLCSARFEATVYDGIPEACNDVINLSPFIQIGRGYYFVENKYELDWFGATHYCRRLDADMVSIESEEEFNALVTYIDAYGYTSPLGIWLSGTDIESEGSYSWFGTGEPMNFTRWASGQPNNQNNFQNCVILYKDGTEYLMNDLICEASANFICEKNNVQIVSLAVW